MIAPEPSVLVSTLPRTPNREATATLYGYVYQTWVSIDVWLRVTANETIFLEGAEDLDRVGSVDADTIQIRATQATISLNTEYGRKAIKQFWDTCQRETEGREIRYQYFTTSDVAIETNACFDGKSGIATWTQATHDIGLAETLRLYLLDNLGATDSLLEFLKNATPTELQNKLFKRFYWLTKQPSVDAVRDTVLDRLAERMSEANYPKPTLIKIRDRLFAHCWEIICKPELTERTLTLATLEQEIERATTVHVSLSLAGASNLLSATLQLTTLASHIESIALLDSGIPEIPHPLLDRKDIVHSVSICLERGESVFISGSAFKGKTTVAAAAALDVCPSAWWIDLSSRQANSTREIINLLALLIETDRAPTLVVLDDLDTSATARKAYTRALQKLLYRAAAIGKSVLVTAQGKSDSLEIDGLNDWRMTVIDVPPMSIEEIQHHCLLLSCPTEIEAEHWSKLISIQTAGHPRLVQVRLIELAAANWPTMRSADYLANSEAVQTAKQLARALFSDSVSSAEAEFVYSAAEYVTFPTREMLLNLADSIQGFSSPGDFINRLVGRWLEALSDTRFRVTPILKANVGETWSARRYTLVQNAVYDSIANCKSLSPTDAATLVFHAFIARNPSRLSQASIKLLVINDLQARNEVYRQLSWLIAVAPNGGLSMFPEAPAVSVTLRQLQFQVALAEGYSAISEIAQAWRREIDELDAQQQAVFEQMFNMVMMTTPASLPPRLILNCATSFRNPQGDSGLEFSKLFNDFRKESNFEEIPEAASNFQVFLALKSNAVQSYEDFIELLDWIANTNDKILLIEFDAILKWPLVSACGAFVHSAWAAEGGKGVVDWSRWVTALESARNLTKTKKMPIFGCEVVRALSIIQCEYLQDPVEGLAVLKKAEIDFPPSAVLAEQRVNVLFQNKDYRKAVDAWYRLIDNFGKNTVTDPFAFRRAALCEVELSNWSEAALLFESGAGTLPPRSALHTKCCMLAEAALAQWKAGDSRTASATMVQCVRELPELEVMEGDRRWEAALRIMVALTKQVAGKDIHTIDGTATIIKPGQVSTPALTVEKLGDRHTMRVKLFSLEVYANELSQLEPDCEAEPTMSRLATDEDPTVRWQASIKMLEYKVMNGVDVSYLGHAITYLDAFLTLHQLSQAQLGEAGKNEEPAMVGVLVLGLLWTSEPLGPISQTWLVEARRLEVDVPVLEAMSKCFSMTLKDAEVHVGNGELSVAWRCGAALNILADDKRTAQMTAVSQGILASVLHDTGIFRLFENFSVQQGLVAKFALKWEGLVRQPATLRSPAISIPALMSEISLAKNGKGRLRQLLAAGAFAASVRMDAIIEKL